RRFAHHRQFLKYCGLDLAKSQSGQTRGQERLSKRGNARLRFAFWFAATVAVRMRENSFRQKYERYIRIDPRNSDRKRKALTAVAAKMARLATRWSNTNPLIDVTSRQIYPVGRFRSVGPSGPLRIL